MSETSERRIPTSPNLAERTPLPLNGARAESRLVDAWREWLRALATDAEAALAAAIAYRELEGDARDDWLTALEQDADLISVPKFAVYAPLLAVESDLERRARIQRAIGPMDSATPSVAAQAFHGISKTGVRIAVLVTPLYLDFAQVLACAYRPDMGFDWVRHDPIVDWRRAPKHGDCIEGIALEGTPLPSVIDDLAHAVLAHRRSGRDLPEALRVFADWFGPSSGGSTPPPPSA
ncbi:MAG: hypothetical protein QM756_30585 [Polyangiaceae bacterium]